MQKFSSLWTFAFHFCLVKMNFVEEHSYNDVGNAMSSNQDREVQVKVYTDETPNMIRVPSRKPLTLRDPLFASYGISRPPPSDDQGKACSSKLTS